MSLLLLLFQDIHLSVSKYSNHWTVLFDSSQILFDFLSSEGILPFLSELTKGLLLRLVPVMMKEECGFRIQESHQSIIFEWLMFERRPSIFKVKGSWTERWSLLSIQRSLLLCVMSCVINSVLPTPLIEILPILVESPSNILRKMFREDSLKGSQSFGSLNVTHESNDNHWRSFHDCYRFYLFFLVHLWSWSIDFSYDVSHACLVSNESRQMNRFTLVIFREGLYFSSSPSRPLFGQEPNMTMSWSTKLSVRLF